MFKFLIILTLTITALALIWLPDIKTNANSCICNRATGYCIYAEVKNNGLYCNGVKI